MRPTPALALLAGLVAAGCSVMLAVTLPPRPNPVEPAPLNPRCLFACSVAQSAGAGVAIAPSAASAASTP